VLDVAGFGRAAAPVLASGAANGGLAGVLGRVRVAAAQQPAAAAALGPAFAGEVALAITPRLPATVVTAVARVADEARAGAALARLQRPISKALGAGAFRSTDVGGVRAWSLVLGRALTITYAVFDKKLVISTSLDAIRSLRSGGGALTGAPAFRATLGNRPDRVTSLTFLDFNQLLTLAEQTGLNQSPTYARVRDDLRRIQAVGAQTSGGEGDSTAELRFQIP
jgi:hypothetical protein